MGEFNLIEYATISEVGERERNEDAVRVFINQRCKTYGFVLADGLGGHGNGDIASNLVADCMGAAIENTSYFNDDFLSECFETAQQMLLDEKELKGLPNIKTTAVLLLITDKVARWGHIGDSRLYHFRDGKQLSRTIDHSVPQLLALNGQIKERDIRHHPDRCILLRAMGGEWTGEDYEINQKHMRLIKGDSFLLCSDGFWEWIDERSMIKVLKKKQSAYDALKEMTAIVKENGAHKGMDNYSAVLVNIK